jgi:PAS domain S-box-containing protein
VAITDQAGKIKFVNDKFCEISGYSCEELLGQNDRIINSSYHSKEFTDGILTTIAGGKVWQGELRNRAMNGPYYWIDMTIVPFLNETGKPYQYVAIGNDITKRKETEERYTQLAAIVESSHDAIIGKTLDGIITSWNLGAEQMYGYTSKEMLGRTIAILIPPEYPTQLKNILETLGSGGQVESLETERVRKDGTRISVAITASPIRDADGKIVGASTIARNITERKRAQIELEESQAQLKTIIENIDEGIAVSDLEGNLLHFNRSALEMHGFADLAECYLHLDEFGDIFQLSELDGTVLPLEQWPLARILRGEKLRDVEICLSSVPNGWQRIFNYGGTLVHDAVGKPFMAVVTIGDITKRKKAEQELKDNEHRFRTLIEYGSDSIALIDKDNKILYLSPSVKNVEGYEPEELLGRSGIELTHPDDLPLVEKTVKELMENPGKPVPVIWRRKHKNGNWIWLEGIATNLLDDPAVGAIVTNYRDVTERIKADEALRNSEHRFRSLIEYGADSILMVDKDNKVIYVSPSVQASEGYTPEEVMGKDRLEHVHPDDIPMVLETRKKLMANPGKPFPLVWRRKHKDGQWRWLEGVVTNFLDDPAVGATVNNYRDITERKKAEEKLRESESRYRLLFENNPFPMWVYDLETLGFLAVNDAAALHYGFSREEFLSMSIKDIRPPEDVAALLENISQPLEKIDTPDVWKHRKKDGTIIEVEVTSHELLFDGKVSRLVLANDVTERKVAEEALRESEAKFRTVAETASDAIITIDENSNILFVNPAAEKIFGYATEEMLGQPLPMLMPSRFQKSHREGVGRFIRTGERNISWKSVLHKQGHEIPLELSFAEYSKEGLRFITSIIRDITERQKAENEIRQLNENLEQRVAQRTLELEAVNNELEAFSYSVSHDLRAPLRAIDGFSLALLEDYGDKFDPTGQNYLERVRAGSQRMANLIDDMLTLSRITRSEIDRKSVDLSKLASEVTERLHESRPDRAVSFNIQPGITAVGDERLLRIALENLLGNAWKFTSKCESAEISFGENGSGKTEFFVSDNGAGFDMAYADKLFGAFQRLHSTNEFEGTGIGLATVQRIIHRLGGEIRAESKVGEGASFFFTLDRGDRG